jgi:hypothetical protein
MVYKSRTDLRISQVPSPVPVMGGMGSIVIDPDFNCSIVRATDQSLESSNSYITAFAAGIGGSADVNIWNTDSTILYVNDSGGGGVILGFNPATLAVKRLFPNWRPIGPCIFSKVGPTVLYNLVGTQFLKYDLSNSDLLVPPNPIVVCDFSTLLPSRETWITVGGIENLDTVFTAAFSTTSGQGSGIYACAYTVGKGYRVWNTQTGTVIGTFGPSGTITCPDRVTIHNVKLNKSGEWLIVAATTHFNANSGDPYYWNINTLEVIPTGHVAVGGHWTGGTSYFYSGSNDSSIPFGSNCKRLYTTPGNVTGVADPVPTPASVLLGLDSHMSFNGPSGQLILLTTTDTEVRTVFPSAWYNEVLGMDVTGTGKMYRFCHTFNSGKSIGFSTANAIGCIDQQNKFVAFSSDWMQTLVGNRVGDVFIVQLQ